MNFWNPVAADKSLLPGVSEVDYVFFARDQSIDKYANRTSSWVGFRLNLTPQAANSRARSTSALLSRSLVFGWSVSEWILFFPKLF